MAKNRNKKKNNGAVSMDITTEPVGDLPQAMDTSEVTISKPVLGIANRKINKGKPKKRSQTLRKMRAIEKAVSKGEKVAEKLSRNKSKMLRIQSAKSLYD